MKIVIDIPGNTNQGLESPERGESRWAQNWAKFLALEGHQITCVCGPNPSWGDTKPVPNCTLVDWHHDFIECEIFMHATWWPGRSIGKLSSKKYVHLHFGWEPQLADSSFIQENHIIAYPFKASAPNFLHKNNPFVNKTFLLPIPLAEKFGKPNFHKKELTYSAKDVFLDRQSKNWYEVGKSTILSMTELAKIHSLKCNFMMYHQLSNQSESKAAYEYDVVNLINNCKHKSTFGLLKLREVYQLLENSKMSFPVIDVGGSAIESVSVGTLPLTWSGGVFSDVAKEANFLLGHHADYQTIYQMVDKALSDEQLYNHLLLEYQLLLSDHLYENSRKYFQQIIDWPGE